MKTMFRIMSIMLVCAFLLSCSKKTTEASHDRVTTPTFSLSEGVYYAAQTLSISCATAGARIYYTSDGTEPTNSSSLYTEPISITAVTTIKAIAYKSKANPSAIATANYIIEPFTGVANPTFSPGDGTYTIGQAVTISCLTAGAKIYYTLDSSEPTLSSTLYSHPIVLTTSVTIKAKAFLEELGSSSIVSAIYTLNNLQTVEIPVFSPPGGTYTSNQAVSISCGTSGAQIRYTTNGNEPTQTSTLYTSPINVSSSLTLKAKAFSAGWNPSITETEVYTINQTSSVAAPQFSLQTGVYNVIQTMSIACSTADAEIHYTTDGSDPTFNSTLYVNPLPINSTTTLKARAYKIGMTASPITTATITIMIIRTATPLFTPQPGVFNVEQSVSIACTTNNAEIHYTTDGSDPTIYSAIYTNPIPVNVTTTLKAKAYKAGLTESLISTATYTLTVFAPQFSVQQGEYNVTQTVSISCLTGGAEIRYTTDGSAPTINSTLYSNPIPINTTTTLRAAAFKTGWTANSTAATYTLTVLAPQLSLQPGVYNIAQSVSITCPTVDAVIRYTTNGSDPTITSTLYSNPITVGTTTTLKAAAFKTGWTASQITTATYTIDIISVATPQFTPQSGVYYTAQSVSINCSTSGAEIHYTTDGSDPTINSIMYSGPISINTTATLKAVAYKTGLTPSSITTATYTLMVLAPQFSPQAGVYNSAQSVSITCPTTDTEIHYTTDGSTPTINSALYISPISVSSTTTLKAVAVKSGWSSSAITTAAYTLTVFAPQFSLQTGLYNAAQSVSITCPTGDAEIRYTTDGSTPTITSTLYLNPIPINVTTTLKATAFKTGWTSSSSSATYTLAALAPQFSPQPGAYNAAQLVSLTCLTSDSVIRYTTDGSEPTITSTLYVNPISVNTTTTLKAVAFKTGWTVSSTSIATYTINILTVNNPQFSVPTGVYYAVQSVIISCSTSGTEIYYTTDGSEPTVNSAMYSGPVSINTTTTLKAIAFKTGWTASSIVTATYTLAVSAPQFSPQAGIYNAVQSVSITCPTSGADIYYTTDGTTPTINSTLYSSSIPVSSTTTVRAAAFKFGWTANLATATYTLAALAPQFSLQTGIFNTPQSVSITCPTNDAEIRYTTDGSTPTINSTLYLNPITINVTTTLKATAFKTGWTSSSSSATYTLAVLAPEFSPQPGIFNVAQLVSLTCLTSESVIRYTTDGSEPTISSTLYVNPISVNTTTTLKAAAFKTGWTASTTSIATYTINILTVTNPLFSVPTGMYYTAQSVSITCSTNGAEIHYTTDGSEPTVNSTIYSSAISINTSSTLKAVAYKTGWTPSAIITATYTLTVLTPQFSPQAGIFNIAQSVSISCLTSESEIHYTTDGSTPTLASSIYTDPITISQTTTLKAVAFKTGWTTSPIATGTYTLTALAPQFSLQSGSFNSTQLISMSCPTEGTEIRYTTNGITPTIASTLYSTPISVSATTTLKAVAFKTGWTASSITTATYTIILPPIDWVYIPGGTFSMGSSVYIDATPHPVQLSAYYMAQFEVTQAEWQAVMGTNPSYFTGDSNKPVEQVNWYAALVYCNKRSLAETPPLTPVYSIGGQTNPALWGPIPTPGSSTSTITQWNQVQCNWNVNGYRLPTEAEWEYAARSAMDAPDSTDFLYSGSSNVDAVAWYLSNAYFTTHERGLKQANSLGLFDMSGNVYEWCWDLYQPFDTLLVVNPTGATSGTDRVCRGGSWYRDYNFAHNRYRSSYDPPTGYWDVGLRVCRNMPNVRNSRRLNNTK